MMNLKIAALAAILLPAAFAMASAEEDDKLCEVIGEAPNLSVPPKDRLWFKDNCVCAGRAGCGKFDSERFRERLDKAAKATAAEKAERGQAENAAAAAREQADKKRREAAAEKRKREAAAERKRQTEASALLPSVMEQSKAIESSDERFRNCLGTAAQLGSPYDQNFCEHAELKFRGTAEGEALYKAERAREEARRQGEAEELARVREACRAFHACIQQTDPHCIEAFDRFLEACNEAHNPPDSSCSNKAGPCG